jgi:uncharacterized protein (DUF1778 family)
LSKDKIVAVRVTESEREYLRRYAEITNLSVSDLLRRFGLDTSLRMADDHFRQPVAK